MADHGVLVMEFAFRSVVDDVLERDRNLFPPSLTLNDWSGLSRRPSRNSGSTVAGSVPIKPARVARSVPCPLPVALRLPNRLTLSAVAFASWSAGSFRQRW